MSTKTEKEPHRPDYEDNYILIKKHKGRGRFEIFIHNTDLRQWLIENPISLLHEKEAEKDSSNRLTKKILFKSSAYGEYAKNFILMIAKETGQNAAAKILDRHQEALDKTLSKWGHFPARQSDQADSFFKDLAQNIKS